jgi:hypothetical protein
MEVHHIMDKLRLLAQHWERLLFSTGGAINTQKSHWYIMHWKWKRGSPSLVKSSSLSATLRLTTGYGGTHIEVPQWDVHSSYRTLCVYISPLGSQLRQAKVLREHAENFYDAVSSSSMSPDEAYWAYMLYLRPRLTYPLPCTSFMEAQCRKIQAPALAALLPKLHLNQHTPHAVIFSDKAYGGLTIPSYFIDQSFNQLWFFIGHLKL